MNTEEIKARMAQIEADMNAHRQGWVSWPSSALADMRKEYAELVKLLKDKE